ncbi:response regulator [Salinisphaera sp. SPP-AMP-43]|uniref:response regulator n=1 Tax=Salinisphaera sp. SPP-AMP-43 TaxID=3121288 RepID=UPI003C6DE796
MRLLLIEDDRLIAEAIGARLDALGHTLDIATRRTEAIDARSHDDFDLILLDLGLPDGDGLALLEGWRAVDDVTPVLILTARDTLDDRVRGLDLGADDYLAKPFAMAELEARVRALLRRARQRTDNRLSLGAVSLDSTTGTAWLGETLLDLPRRELRLLEALLAGAERTVTRELLEQRLFGFDEVGSNALEVYVSRLRKRLQGSGVAIRTLRGLGYRLEPERT